MTNSSLTTLNLTEAILQQREQEALAKTWSPWLTIGGYNYARRFWKDMADDLGAEAAMDKQMNMLLDYHQSQRFENVVVQGGPVAKRKTLQQELDTLNDKEKKQLASMCQESLDHDQPLQGDDQVFALQVKLDTANRQRDEALTARDYWEKAYYQKRARPTFMELGYALTTWFRDLAIGLLLIAIAVNMGLYVYGWIQ